MEIWRLYLQQLAELEGNLEGQIVAAAYRAGIPRAASAASGLVVLSQTRRLLLAGS